MKQINHEDILPGLLEPLSNLLSFTNLPFAPLWDWQRDIRERKDILTMYSRIAIRRNDWRYRILDNCTNNIQSRWALTRTFSYFVAEVCCPLAYRCGRMWLGAFAASRVTWINYPNKKSLHFNVYKHRIHWLRMSSNLN